MMALHTFYHEASPEPPDLDDYTEDRRKNDSLGLPDHRSMLETCGSLFGTPVISPRFLRAASDRMADLYASLTPFEYELEKLQEEERSRRNSSHSSAMELDAATAKHMYGSEACEAEPEETSTPKAGPMDLPAELWDLIFSYVVPNSEDDSYQKLGDLFNSALVCRAWAYMALPFLYRTHGYGVFMPRPATQDDVLIRFPFSRSITIHTMPPDKRARQLWRTLILSCFTAQQPTSASRFDVFAGATLFPYIKYVQFLDMRTLVMALSEIMRSRRLRSDDCDMDDSSQHSVEAANYFFAGALGAFEISGATRGTRTVVGGCEYGIQPSVWGKEVKLFVGDTALMIMDFLYPHLHHLKGFTIAELGQLRVSSPVTMAHPVSLLTSLTSLNSLVISSGWMVSAGLGRAIAAIRPTITDQGTRFNLTILDWKIKTHYDPNYHHNEDWEDDHEEYRYTIHSAVEFFNALNPNSLTSLDIDFDVRFSRLQQGDLGDGTIAIRQSSSLQALRIAHLRCENLRQLDILLRMGEHGFRPRALSLIELYKPWSHPDPGWGILPLAEKWTFLEGMFSNLEDLELVRFPGMFDLAADILIPKSRDVPLIKLQSLKLSYTSKHVEEDRHLMPLQRFPIHYISQFATTLTTLKLCDTLHNFRSQTEPGLRASFIYDEHEKDISLPSPLESLINLRVLILVGDISFYLMRGRLWQVLAALQNSLMICDLCFSLPCLKSKLAAFWVCRKLTHLYVREWNWDVDELVEAKKLLRTEDVKDFVEGFAREPRVPKGPMGSNQDGNQDEGEGDREGQETEWEEDKEGDKVVLKELGIDGGLLQVAARQNWGEVQKWVGDMGCRFVWSPQQMWRVGHVAFNGRDPSFV